MNIMAVLGLMILFSSIGLKIAKLLKIKVMLVGIIAGISLITLSGALFYAEAGYQYMVQYPTGKQVHISKPGYNLKLWGDVLPFKNIITVRLTEDKDENSETATVEDNSVRVLFNDGVRAKISQSTRFKMPTNSDNFIKMARDFRTESNLITNSLIPISKEVIVNSARELGAQKYISGGGGVFENSIYEQMQHGIVMLTVKEESKIKEEETINPETGEKRTIKSKPVIVTIIARKLNKDGSVKRKTHALLQYGIGVTQSTVEEVNFEPKFKKMIEQQRDATARANIEKQKAKEAEYAQKRIVAEGEKDKAQERALMEKQQVTSLITAETAKKKEEYKRDQAGIALETARIEAENVTVRAKADADARKLKMVADGALSMKLDAWIKVNSKWADAMSQNRMVPEVVVGGNGKGGGNSTDFMNMMTAMSAQQLGVNTTISK